MFDSLIVSSPGEEIRLRQESEEDNVEYKLRLDTKTNLGKKRLLSQLNYRLDVGKTLYGKKEAHYVLGICDDGSLGKLNEQEIDDSFSVLSEIINKADAIITHIDKKKFGDFFLIYVIVQKIETYRINELNVAFVGGSQHGKTTTVSHLVYGQYDDGNGYARKLVFKHEHEKMSGITSSIKKEIVGLRKGKLVNYSIGITTGWQDIVEMSDKIINLIDLPGNMKYFRSIFFGLSTYQIDGLIIVVDITKLDNININEIMFYKLYAETFGISYTFLVVNDLNTNDRTNYTNEFNFLEKSNVIYFSNLSNFGYDEIISFLDRVESKKFKNNMDQYEPLFCVMETYYVPDAGTIFSGIMTMGSLSLNDNVLLTNGQTYYKTKIKSIHRKQIDSATLYTNETGAIQLDFDGTALPEVNKHMIITTNELQTYDHFEFESLNKLQNEGLLKPGQKCVMFVDNVITNVHIKLCDDKIKIQSENKIVVPSLNKHCVAFLKSDNSVIFGKLNVV